MVTGEADGSSWKQTGLHDLMLQTTALQPVAHRWRTSLTTTPVAFGLLVQHVPRPGLALPVSVNLFRITMRADSCCLLCCWSGVG